MDHIISSFVIAKQEQPCGVLCKKPDCAPLWLPQSQKATCIGFDSSELEYSRLV